MFSLIMYTLLTSAIDSLNPIAIAQQFVLQGMVKKAKHIWYFIISIAITNFTTGVLAYYGAVKVLSSFFSNFFNTLGVYLYIAELVLGFVFLFITIRILYKQRLKNKLGAKELVASTEEEQKSVIPSWFRSVTPFSLTLIGIVATISELTTALPYFAFIAILLNYEISLIQVLLILVLYNFVYSLPLIIMYFIYVKKQSMFDRFYLFTKEKMTKWSSVLTPLVVFAVAMFFIIHSTINI